MVVVHAIHAEDLPHLRRILPQADDVWLASDPGSFREAVRDSDAMIVVGDGGEPPAWLVRWRGRHPDPPLVLVAERKLPPRTRGALMTDEVWRGQPAAEALPGAVRQARLLGILHRWAGVLAAEDRFPSPLRSALVRAVRSEPVPNVDRIVRWTGGDRSTVNRWWRRVVGPRPPPG